MLSGSMKLTKCTAFHAIDQQTSQLDGLCIRYANELPDYEAHIATSRSSVVAVGRHGVQFLQVKHQIERLSRALAVEDQPRGAP